MAKVRLDIDSDLSKVFTELKELRDELNKSNRELDEAKRTLRDLGQKGADSEEKLRRSIAKEAGARKKLNAQIQRDGAKRQAQIKSENTALQSRIGILGNTKKIALELGTIFGAGLGVAALISGFRSFVALSGELENTITRVSALTRATAEQEKALANEIKRLGREKSFTANEVGEAAVFLAQAGFDAEKTTKALEGTLNLAAAGMLDLGTAADIATNALSAYKLEAEELNRVNDIIAYTTSKSNTNVVQFFEGFKVVAPIAQSAGIEMEELASAIGKLGDAGIQGSLAGTNLRGVINSLINPSSEATRILKRLGVTTVDQTGKLRPLADVFEELNKAQVSTTELFQIFGQRAASGAAVLTGVAPDIRTFTDEIKSAGGFAEELANKQLDTLRGSGLLLKSAIQGVSTEIGDNLNPVVRGAADLFTKMFNSINVPVLVEFVKNLALVAGAFLGIRGSVFAINSILSFGTRVIRRYTVAVNLMAISTNRAATAQRIWNTLLKANVYVLAAAALVGLIYLISKYRVNVEKARAAHLDLAKSINDGTNEIVKQNRELEDAIKTYTEISEKAMPPTVEQQNKLNESIDTIRKIVPLAVLSIDEYGNTIIDNKEKLTKFLNEQKKFETKIKQLSFKDLINDIKHTSQELSNSAYIAEQARDQFNRLSESGAAGRTGEGELKYLKNRFERFNKAAKESFKTLREQLTEAIKLADDLGINFDEAINKLIEQNPQIDAGQIRRLAKEINDEIIKAEIEALKKRQALRAAQAQIDAAQRRKFAKEQAEIDAQKADEAFQRELENDKNRLRLLDESREKELKSLELKYRDEYRKAKKQGLDLKLLQEVNRKEIDDINKKWDEIDRKRREDARESALTAAIQAARDEVDFTYNRRLFALEQQRREELKIFVGTYEQRNTLNKKFDDQREKLENERKKAIIGAELLIQQELLRTTLLSGTATGKQIDDIMNRITELGIALQELDGQSAEIHVNYVTPDKKDVKAKDFVNDLFDALKVPDELRDDIKQAASEIGRTFADAYNQSIQNELDQNQILLDSIKDKQTALEQQLADERDLKKQGFANDVDLVIQKIALEKELEEQALRDREAILKRQQSLELIQRASSLSLAVAQILASESKLGIAGIFLAAGAISSLYALYNTSKEKAISAARLATGATGDETGMIIGKRHTQDGGENFLDHVKVESGERWSVFNRKASRLNKKQIIDFTKLINAGEFPSNINLKELLSGTGVSLTPDLKETINIFKNYKVENRIEADQKESVAELKRLNKGVDKLLKNDKDKQRGRKILYEDSEMRVEQEGNVTRRIFKR